MRKMKGVSTRKIIFVPDLFNVTAVAAPPVKKVKRNKDPFLKYYKGPVKVSPEANENFSNIPSVPFSFIFKSTL
jgi:hypothetical protein